MSIWTVNTHYDWQLQNQVGIYYLLVQYLNCKFSKLQICNILFDLFYFNNLFIYLFIYFLFFFAIFL